MQLNLLLTPGLHSPQNAMQTSAKLKFGQFCVSFKAFLWQKVRLPTHFFTVMLIVNEALDIHYW